MGVKIAQVMAKRVIFTEPEHEIGHVRELLARHHIHALPVVGAHKKVVGIVTTADLARRWADHTPVKRAMTTFVQTVKANAEASEAARIMRKHRIHHVVVTDQNKVVGIVSSLDLLGLVEERKYSW